MLSNIMANVWPLSLLIWTTIFKGGAAEVCRKHRASNQCKPYTSFTYGISIYCVSNIVRDFATIHSPRRCNFDPRGIEDTSFIHHRSISSHISCCILKIIIIIIMMMIIYYYYYVYTTTAIISTTIIVANTCQ